MCHFRTYSQGIQGILNKCKWGIFYDFILRGKVLGTDLEIYKTGPGEMRMKLPYLCHV